MKRILFLLVALQASLANADFYKALDKYAEGHYQQAYDSFYEMAKLGEKRAQFNLGVMFYHGQHVEKDINQAYGWMKLALESETISENEKKIFDSLSKEVTQQDEAQKVYKALSQQYGTDALMVELYPSLVDPKKGISFNATPVKLSQPDYPRNAAFGGIQGWAKVSFHLDKNGTPRNINLVESVPQGIFDKAVLKSVKKWKFKVESDEFDNGLSKVRLNYTMEFRLKGHGALSVKSELYQKTLKLAEQGDASSQYVIGFWQSKLPSSSHNSNPTEWFLKSARQGLPQAQYQLGVSLLKGQGCLKDQEKGVEWLVRAAANNEHEATRLLAIRSASDESLDSQRKAIEYFSKIDASDNYAKIVFARLLATSPHAEIRDPKKALAIVEDVNHIGFSDDITPYEIKGEAYAALGDKSEAIDMFEDALDEAEEVDADTSYIQKRIAELSR